MVAYRPHVAVGAGQVLGRPHCVGEAHIVKVEHVLHSVEAPHSLLLTSCLLVEALQFILNVLKQRIVKLKSQVLSLFCTGTRTIITRATTTKRSSNSSLTQSGVRIRPL